MTPTMSPRSRTLATVCAAVLAGALALGFGGWVGDTVRTHQATDTTTTSPAVYVPATDTTPDTSSAPREDDTSSDQPAGVDPCAPFTLVTFEAAVAAGEMAPTVWDELMVIGWIGDPTDHMEALYAPGCVAP